ncbi:MAG: hypothetical protein KUF74_10920 [Candidatus Thiodiazotropha sp. (ex Ctena orbiculata)]|nr:hypothetical protein [Candidatus Thiodiazotropha taylori]
MILDSVENLNEIYKELVVFAGSKEQKIKINAIVKGNPEPYSEFLPYIELSKTEGKILVIFSEDRGLVITGSTANLLKYIEAFRFNSDEDGNHHHPEFGLVNENSFSMGGLWPFIEADNDYVAEHQAFAS